MINAKLAASKSIIHTLLLLFTFVFSACNPAKNQSEINANKIKNRNLISPIFLAMDSSNKINPGFITIANLQGYWGRIDYPLSTIEFKNNMVKLTEEGMHKTPQFKQFLLRSYCNDSSQISANMNLQYLYLPEDKTCGRLTVNNDTLRISNTVEHFEIIYKRILPEYKH